MPDATHRRLRRAAGSAAAALLLASGCAADVEEPAARHDHGADGHHHAEERVRDDASRSPGPAAASPHRPAGHDHGHSSSADLSEMLVDAALLPSGYRPGHAHASPAAAAPALDPACAPLAEVIGTHPSVRQTTHPQAGRVFSKSHFGPTLSEVIIDYGDRRTATAAVARLGRAAAECDRYVQSESRIGANRYTVHSGAELPDVPGAGSVRLRAVGAQFDTITWDVVWVRSGVRVLAVGHRTAPGGDGAGLAGAVRAAVEAAELSPR